MGWKESDRVSQRQEFVRLAESKSLSMTELCQRFKVSRKTGYKWLGRWESEGPDGLKDRSRRPKTVQSITAPEIESHIIEARKAHPCWGGRTLRKLLLNQGVEDVPTASTITRILHRHG